MHRNITRECDKLIVTCYEISLTRKLDQGTYGLVAVNIRINNTGAKLAVTLFFSDAGTLFAQDKEGLFFVATCFLECFFTLHNRNSCHIAQFFDLFGCDHEISRKVKSLKSKVNSILNLGCTASLVCVNDLFDEECDT